MFFRRLIFLSVLCLLAVMASGAAPEPFPGLNRKWKYYQSPNFELYSARSDAASRDLLESMELLRALFLDTFKLPVRLPQPVTIFAFDAQKDFDGYLSPERRGKVTWGGFCLALPDRTTITLAPTYDPDDAGKIVFHEYIHCLFHMTEEDPPSWFNEGAAELFSTMKLEREWLILGTPIPGRVQELRDTKLMPLEQLFAVNYDSAVFKSDKHTGLFYSESWALLHYLKFGVNKIPPGKISAFLRAAQSPWAQAHADEFKALTKELLGRDYPQLQADLDSYVRSGQFNSAKVRRPEIKPKAGYTVRPVTVEEMTPRLAELSLRFTRSSYARLAVRNQADRQPETRLYEVLGTMALQDNEPDAARDYWLKAFELGTTNVAIFRELSRLESNLVFSHFDLDYRLPEERARRLREMLTKSIAEAPTQSNGYEMLAWVEASAQKPDIGAINRVQAQFATLNNKPRTLLALALVRMRLGDEKAALEVLTEMDKLKPDDWVLYCMELTRARLEKRPVDPKRLPRMTDRPPGSMIMSLPKLELPH